MLATRHATPHDYEAIAAIRNLVTSEQTTAADLIATDRRNSSFTGARTTRIVALAGDGKVAGYALCGHFSDMADGTCWLHVTTHPDIRRQGIGDLLYRAGLAFDVGLGAREILSTCREEFADALAWAARRGFVAERQRAESVLDLTGWDPAPFQADLDRVTQAGIRLAMLHEVRSEPILQSLYELLAETQPDVPGFSGKLQPYADWVGEFRQDSGLLVSLAFDGDTVVGASIAGATGDLARSCYIRFTGVRRAYRGRSIARAVKISSIREAAARGHAFIWTHNDLDNPAILALNTALGFRRTPGAYSLRKHISLRGQPLPAVPPFCEGEKALEP